MPPYTPQPWLALRVTAPIRSTPVAVTEAEIEEAISPDYVLQPIVTIDLSEEGWTDGDWSAVRAILERGLWDLDEAARGERPLRLCATCPDVGAERLDERLVVIAA